MKKWFIVAPLILLSNLAGQKQSPIKHTRVMSEKEVKKIIEQLWQETVGGDIKWVINTLKKYNDFATIRNIDTGNNLLLLALKNYSGASDEDELIVLLIKIAPSLITLYNDSGENIFLAINSHPFYQTYLSVLVKNTVAQIAQNIDTEIIERATVLLKTHQYKRFVNLFLDHPYLVYYQDSNKKTLLEYCKEANGALDKVEYWIHILKL